MKKEDGAYYALKGFIFQFDKTILQILSQVNENEIVKIEQEQDLEYENYVVQVKYHETEYNKSQQKQKVKNATVKLLQEFENNQAKKYCLYIYLKGKTPNIDKYNTVIDFDDLLGNKASEFSAQMKQKFIQDFNVVYATDFKTQFHNIIQKLKKEFNVSNEELAYSYHALISNHLLNIVLNNTLSNSDKRICTKKELKDLIDNTKSIVFKSAYSEFLGEKKYFLFLKQQFECATKNNNYLFIGNNITETPETNFAELIEAIVDKYYLNVKNKAKGKVHPFNIVLQKNDDEINKIKEELIDRKIWFNDGFKAYGFSEEYFNSHPVLETDKSDAKIKKSSFYVRIISYDDFQKYEIKIKPHKLFIFANDIQANDLFKNYKPGIFAVDDLSLTNIKKLFNKR